MKKKLKNNNNQKQVIYLICSPLSVRDYERFGISNWINANWKVKVFDITKFLLPKFWLHTNGDRNSFKFQGLTIFSNVKDILSTINKIKDKVIFIDMLGFSYTESKIRKAAITNGKVVRINLGTIPKFQPRKNILEILTLIINPIKLTNKIFQFLNNKIHQNRAKKYHPDYLVVGGLNSIKKFDKEKTSLIKAHNLDYDFFIKEKQIASNKDCNFLVFLDEDGPYHSDFIRFGIESYIKPKNYYPVIDLGLIKIAKLLKLNIKIAAHPRSSYSTKKIKYKHPIIENNTFELIRNSSVSLFTSYSLEMLDKIDSSISVISLSAFL